MNLKKIAFALAPLLVPANALAVDAACAPMISASEARLKQAEWHSIAVFNGDFRMELIKADGAFFTKIGDSWSASPASLDAAESSMLAQIQSGEVKLTQCSSGDAEVVDGIAVYAFKSRVEMQGAPAEDSTLYIGKADGLPYKQVSKSVNVTYKYQNVVPPKI